MADPIDVALVIIGSFYALGGFVAVRAGLTSHFLDVALEKISMKPTPRAEAWQTRWLLVASAVIFTGGVTLIIRSNWAAALFLLSALAQLAYVFVVAPIYFDKEQAMDRASRRQTVNAMVVYLAATAFVLWAFVQGRLFAFRELSPLSWAIATALMLAMAAYLVRVLWWPSRAPADDANDWDDYDEPRDSDGDRQFEDVDASIGDQRDHNVNGGDSDEQRGR